MSESGAKQDSHKATCTAMHCPLPRDAIGRASQLRPGGFAMTWEATRARIGPKAEAELDTVLYSASLTSDDRFGSAG